MDFKAFKSLAILSCASFALVEGGVGAAAPALAQSAAPQAVCEVSMTEITTLPEPGYGLAPSNWLFLEPGEGMDVFTDLLALPDGHLLAVGAFSQDPKDEGRHPLMIRYDERFKKVWELRAQAPHHQDILRILPAGEAYAVLGRFESEGGVKGFYIGTRNDQSPKAQSEDTEAPPAGPRPITSDSAKNDKRTEAQPVANDTIIVEQGARIDAKGMVYASDGSGFLIAATWESESDTRQKHGLLYKFSPSGRLLWKRAYRPGATSLFQNIHSTLEGDYMISGQILTSPQKASGFIMRVDKDGAIKWQQSYPRGQSAVIHAATPMADGGFLLTGRVLPLPGADGGIAALVMKVDGNGAVQWQRYLRGLEYDYSALEGIVYEDGRASVMVNGIPLRGYGRAHTRLITFSERGEIHYREDFTDGQNAYAARLITGSEGQRLIAGHAQTGFGEDEDAPAPSYTYDGWLLSAVSLEPFDDPCAKPVIPDPLLP